MIGINDVSHDLTTDSIANMIERTAKRIRQESPTTTLYLQSILPINESFGRYKRLSGKTDQIPDINKRIKSLSKELKCTFIDLFPHFCEKGSNILQKNYSTDGLHLNEDGYKIWVKQLKKYL